MLLWHGEQLGNAMGKALGVHEASTSKLRLADKEGEHVDEVEVEGHFLVGKIIHLL